MTSSMTRDRDSRMPTGLVPLSIRGAQGSAAIHRRAGPAGPALGSQRWDS